jgi:hypothetical protein
MISTTKTKKLTTTSTSETGRALPNGRHEQEFLMILSDLWVVHDEADFLRTLAGSSRTRSPLHGFFVCLIFNDGKPTDHSLRLGIITEANRAIDLSNRCPLSKESTTGYPNVCISCGAENLMCSLADLSEVISKVVHRAVIK